MGETDVLSLTFSAPRWRVCFDIIIIPHLYLNSFHLSDIRLIDLSVSLSLEYPIITIFVIIITITMMMTMVDHH